MSRGQAGWTGRARGLVAVVVVALAGVGGYVLSRRAPVDAHGRPRTASTAGDIASSQGASDERRDAPQGDAMDGEKPIPDGALGPILTDPDPNRIPFCDERNWPRVRDVVRSSGRAPEGAEAEGLITVDESVWSGLDRSARRGIAGWASRCELGGGSVVVRGAGSGADLGRYDGSSGFFSEPDAGS